MSLEDKGLGGYRKMIEELGGVEDALSLTFQQSAKLHSAYLNPYVVWISRFLGFNKRFVKASGCYLFDEGNKRYLDFLAGFGALNLGHEPPEVIQALRQVENQPNFLQSYLNPLAGKFAEYLVHLTSGKLSRVFFCNSGAEACEAGIKLARAASKKRFLVYTQGAFHGKTMGALSVSGREKYKTPFMPLVPDTISVPYNNEEAVEAVLRKGNVAAFIVEPIQGEAGVIVPREGYLKSIRKLCDEYNALLIVDEVQTGMGRTGRFFCYEYEEVIPDILLLSKSLGGGVMPIGAMLAKDSIWRRAYGSLEKCLLHTTTFGGNSRACACGIAAVQLLLSKGLIKNAETMGKLLLSKLSILQSRYSILKSVRGKGLMIGLSIARVKGKKSLMEGALALWIAGQLLKRHQIITAFTLNNYDVLRLAPPLMVSEEDICYFVNSLEDVLKSAEKFSGFGFLKREHAH